MPKFNDDYFDALTKDREDSNRVLKKKSMGGVKKSVVEKYSDQAHFIYELLQNADDAKASKASFILEKDRLIFKHNGTRKFTISDPDTEEEDSQTGALGDINAITSIGNSSKLDHESNTIGKFGVGFKAVFQYTDTPHIYDQNICFKIEEFIVPKKLDHDYPTRKIDETVFVFPFNRASLSPENAYQEIKAKLENLDNPVLFLSNLKDVSYVTEDSKGLYRIERIESRTFALNTNAEKLKIHYDDTDDTDQIWLFSRNTDNKLKYSVGFWVDDNDNFIPWSKDHAFCYFSTKVVTHLNFIIHAPFLLTDSREGIKASEEHNSDMIQHLAELAGDALLYFHEMDTPEHRYITEDILQLIPLDETLFKEVGDIDEISFKPFYTEILKRFKTEELIPGKEHCVSSSHAYWANVPKVMELFSNEQLQQITGDPMAEWIFPSKGRDSLQRANKPQFNYIEGLRRDYFDDSIEQRNILKKLTPQFIESQPVDWLSKFYHWCVETANRRIEAMRHPIFLNKDRKAVIACTSNYNNDPKIFLPDDEMPEVESVHKDLIINHSIKEILVNSFGLKKPDKFDYIKFLIIPKYKKGIPADTTSDFLAFFTYYINCTRNQDGAFFNQIASIPFIEYLENDKIKHSKASELYLPDSHLETYLKACGIETILDINKYAEFVKNSNLELNIDINSSLLHFFRTLGAKEHLSIVNIELISYQKYSQESYSYLQNICQQFLGTPNDSCLIPIELGSSNHRDSDRWRYTEIEGLRKFILYIEKSKSQEHSFLLWDILKSIPQSDFRALSECTYEYQYYGYKRKPFKSLDLHLLMTRAWLVSNEGEFIAINEYNKCLYENLYTPINFRSTLSQKYDTNSLEGGRLCEILGIKDTPIPLQLSKFNRPLPSSNFQTQEEIIADYKKQHDEDQKTIAKQNQEIEVLKALLKQEEEEKERKKEEKRLRAQSRQTNYSNPSSNALKTTPADDEAYDDDSINDDKDRIIADQSIEIERLKAQLKLEANEDEEKSNETPLSALPNHRNFSNPIAESKDNVLSGEGASDNKSTQIINELNNSFLHQINDRLSRLRANLQNEIKPSQHVENDYSHIHETSAKYTADSLNARPIAKQTETKLNTISNDANVNADDDIEDADENLPRRIDYTKRVNWTINTAANQIFALEHQEKLQATAKRSQMYTFGWFKALTELEAICCNENSKNSKKVNISFGKVARELGTDRTLILSRPNIPIPPVIEDLCDIPMLMSSRDCQYHLVIEAASIRSFNLRVKVRDMSLLKTVDLTQICEIRIEAKSPAFLWDELLKGFNSLNLPEDYNMQRNLPGNIKFIFGPPGTGKTTYLSEKIIIPMMTKATPCRMLILAPTNKAADVIVRRVMSLMKDNMSYRKWLVRFGTTSDDTIEQSGVFRDRVVDIESFERLVLVTTIARFPYDYFITNNKHIQISEMNWDQIVFDEASMIPAANIVYPLYKKKPDIFYIAGDPFQISPITSVNLWEGETIYTMTGLNSFSNPKTVPHNYKITSLKTQYRSIPEIGSIFSTFKYNGILEHNRTSESRKPLNIDLDVKSLNLIEFPVSRYESIYRCKRLNQSSNYQIYSAIFTYEFACYLARELYASAKNSREKFNIGIISPYRVQADLIGKLISAEKLPESVDIQTGTIHSFQGDECDIIFAIFNPPEKISEKSFVNRDNIINVAISRARDYLFVIMPDMNTHGIENMHRVNCVKNLMKNSQELRVFQSSELEEVMFNDPTYIEENAFSTSHQSVNVYGEPERVYEIRSESTAIDVQVHRKSRTKPAQRY